MRGDFRPVPTWPPPKLAAVGTLVLGAMSTQALDPLGDHAGLSVAPLPTEAPAMPDKTEAHETSGEPLNHAHGTGSQNPKPAAGSVLASANTVGNIVAETGPASGHGAAASIAASAASPPAPDGHIGGLGGEIAALLSKAYGLNQYDIGGVSLVASFDPAQVQALQIAGAKTGQGTVDLHFEAPQLATPAPASAGSTYDEAARAFVSAFWEQSDDIEILTSLTKLVLIDLTAFDDTMDRAYAYSWTLDDGGTISTLGHIEFFASHALA